MQKDKKKTVFQVDGITCLDCAQKFEKAVSGLPGIKKATLNKITGKLVVEGTADLKSIRKLGETEAYTIRLIMQKQARKIHLVPKTGWELRRAALAGLSLLTAYGLESFGIDRMVFLPLYVLAAISGGWSNFSKAARALPRFSWNMSVLMSVAVIGAFAIHQYREGATVAFLYSISEMLEAWTMDKVRLSIQQLMDIAPKTAWVMRSGREEEVSVEDIEIGDTIVIRPGEKIAMDGEIVKGDSAVNQAAITGESVPVEKKPGEEVFAGTLNTYGFLEVRVTKLVQDTTIAKIIQMVEEAQTKRAPSQAFVERFAAVYTPVVMSLALGILLIPPAFFNQEWTPWVYRSLALLIVACPCALVVSTPLAIVSAISNAAKNGVLIKGGIHLEAAGSLNAIAFDKTGTLTQGVLAVTDIIAVGSIEEEKLLKAAADLEMRSEHPLAKAILRAAKRKNYRPEPVDEFTAFPGRGVQGKIQQTMFYLGNLRLFSEMGMPLEPVSGIVHNLQGAGKTVMVIGSRDELLGIIAVADEVREASAEAVSTLKRAGIQHIIMLTGDNLSTAKAVAAKAGVDEYRAELLPKEKLTAMRELIKKYGKVAMVGDGINDAPALALATVGIAMGGAGTDTALETADIALMADDLSKLPFTVRLSRKALSVIRQNITFSLLIKAVALLAVFPGWLTLWLAILADMGATILVTLNSLRLLRADLKEKRAA